MTGETRLPVLPLFSPLFTPYASPSSFPQTMGFLLPFMGENGGVSSIRAVENCTIPGFFPMKSGVAKKHGGLWG